MVKKTESKLYENIITNMKERYGIRFKKKQKQKFIEYAKAEFEKMGYTTQIQESRKYRILNRNFIIGDLEKASIVLCAHYDTPPLAPYKVKILKGSNVSKYDKSKEIVWTILKYLSLFMLLLLLNLNGIIYFSTMIIVAIRIYCIPNKKNLNDNTSGIMTIFEVAYRFANKPSEQFKNLDKSKVAFILFDNEEKNMLGSKIFKCDNLNIENKLFINFDCVGIGENIVISGDYNSKIEAKKIGGYEKHIEGKNILVETVDLSKAKSDEKMFEKRIRFATYHKNKKDQLYIENIHSKKDDDIDPDNIKIISSIIEDYITKELSKSQK